MEGKRGHYIKKKSKEQVTLNEQEHDEMLKVAKVKKIFLTRNKIKEIYF